MDNNIDKLKEASEAVCHSSKVYFNNPTKDNLGWLKYRVERLEQALEEVTKKDGDIKNS